MRTQKTMKTTEKSEIEMRISIDFIDRRKKNGTSMAAMISDHLIIATSEKPQGKV
jgi:hypothetical protein